MLPVDQWGIYRTAFAYVGLFRLLPDLGMSYASTLAIVRDRKLATSLIGNLLGFQGVLSLATLALALALGPIVIEDRSFDGLLSWAVAILTVDLALKSFKLTLRWLLKAFERFGTEAVSLLAERVMLLVCGIGVLASGGGVLGFVLVFACVRLVDTSGLWAYITRRVSPLVPRWDVRVWMDLARRGLPFAFAGGMVTVFFQIDQVLLKRMKGLVEVGYYATPVLVLEGLSLIPRILGFALIPTMAALSVSNPRAVTELYRRAVKYLLVAGLPIAAFGVLCAEPFVRWIFGNPYLPSVGLTRILLPSAAFMFLSNLAETTLACISRWRVIVLAATSAAIINVVLNLVWIPPYGAQGAAWATLATEAFYFLATTVLLARAGHSAPWLTIALRPLGATVPFAATLWLTASWPIWASSSVASAIFIVATFVLGVWDDRERSLLAGFLRSLSARLRPGR
jgi:O-antigen/teichoic acid export membrane protein